MPGIGLRGRGVRSEDTEKRLVTVRAEIPYLHFLLLLRCTEGSDGEILRACLVGRSGKVVAGGLCEFESLVANLNLKIARGTRVNDYGADGGGRIRRAGICSRRHFAKLCATVRNTGLDRDEQDGRYFHR